MAFDADPTRLTRCMLAIGRKRLALEAEGQARARIAAMHPASLDQLTSLFAACYRRSARPEDVFGVKLVADHSVPRGRVELRA